MKKWRMTFNNKEMSGCSARGIATAQTKEELEALAQRLKEKIYNVKIEAPDPDQVGAEEHSSQNPNLPSGESDTP